MIPIDGFRLHEGDLAERLNSKIKMAGYPLKNALGVFDVDANGLISYAEFVTVLNNMYDANLSRKEMNTIRAFFKLVAESPGRLEIP